MTVASQYSKLVWKRKKLETKNGELRSKYRLAKGLAIAMTAFSAVCAGYTYKITSDLNRTRQENKTLNESISFFKKNGADLSAENKILKEYAEDAQTFALGLRPWLDEHDFTCEKTDCAECRKIEKENDRKVDEFSKAMDTLNIDCDVLYRLQEGYQKE